MDEGRVGSYTFDQMYILQLPIPYDSDYPTWHVFHSPTAGMVLGSSRLSVISCLSWLHVSTSWTS